MIAMIKLTAPKGAFFNLGTNISKQNYKHLSGDSEGAFFMGTQE